MTSDDTVATLKFVTPEANGWELEYRYTADDRAEFAWQSTNHPDLRLYLFTRPDTALDGVLHEFLESNLVWKSINGLYQAASGLLKGTEGE